MCRCKHTHKHRPAPRTHTNTNTQQQRDRQDESKSSSDTRRSHNHQAKNSRHWLTVAASRSSSRCKSVQDAHRSGQKGLFRCVAATHFSGPAVHVRTSPQCLFKSPVSCASPNRHPLEVMRVSAPLAAGSAFQLLVLGRSHSSMSGRHTTSLVSTASISSFLLVLCCTKKNESPPGHRLGRRCVGATGCRVGATGCRVGLQTTLRLHPSAASYWFCAE